MKQQAAPAASALDPNVNLYHLEKNDWTCSSLSVVVVGASGDLAKKKIFPALFALYYEGLLPQNFQVTMRGRSSSSSRESGGRTCCSGWPACFQPDARY